MCGGGGEIWHVSDPFSAHTEGSVENRVFASLPSDDPWGAVCQQPEAQRGVYLWPLPSPLSECPPYPLPAYLQGMSEILLYLVLPEEDFHNAALRHLMRVCPPLAGN